MVLQALQIEGDEPHARREELRTRQEDAPGVGAAGGGGRGRGCGLRWWTVLPADASTRFISPAPVWFGCGVSAAGATAVIASARVCAIERAATDIYNSCVLLLWPWIYSSRERRISARGKYAFSKLLLRCIFSWGSLVLCACSKGYRSLQEIQYPL